MATLKEIRMHQKMKLARMMLSYHANPTDIIRTLMPEEKGNNVMSKDTKAKNRCKDCRKATNNRTLYLPMTEKIGDNPIIVDCEQNGTVSVQDSCSLFTHKQFFPPILEGQEFEDLYAKVNDEGELFDLSILKWDRILAQEDNPAFIVSPCTNIGICALCKKYDTAKSQCTDCPLKSCRVGSLYADNRAAKLAQDRVVFFRTAQVMRDKLISLKEEWVKAEEAKKLWNPKVGDCFRIETPYNSDEVFMRIQEGEIGVCSVDMHKEGMFLCIDLRTGEMWGSKKDPSLNKFGRVKCNRNGTPIV